MFRHATKGSTGMIALLISVLLISLAYVYLYLTPREIVNPELKAIQPLTASGTVPTTGIERARADVNAANAAQELLNAHNRATIKALSE